MLKWKHLKGVTLYFFFIRIVVALDVHYEQNISPICCALSLRIMFSSQLCLQFKKKFTVICVICGSYSLK